MAACAHKPKLLLCTKCGGRVCSACVQLEVHGCPGLQAAKKAELAGLEARLVKVVAPKVAPL